MADSKPEQQALAVPEKQQLETSLVSTNYFSAVNTKDMEAAQKGLGLWIAEKLRQVRIELRDATQALNIAKERKWASGPHERRQRMLKGMKTFYEKILAAVECGYVLIPDLPCSVFAIRVRRENARRQERITQSGWEGQSPLQPADKLEVGEGRYVSAEGDRRYKIHRTTEEGKEITKYKWFDVAFQDVTFPLVAAQPLVMSATAQAMTQKIFDEIGVLPRQRRAKGDPLIVGIIRGQKQGGYAPEKLATFLIAWHVDMRRL